MTVQRRKLENMPIERLKALLSYDPLSGIFRLRTSRGKKKGGDEAGYINNLGYRLIFLDGAYYLAHCAVAYAPPKVRLRDAYNYRRAA